MGKITFIFGGNVSRMAKPSRSPLALLKRRAPLAPDGRYLITSVGLRQRTVSVHYANDDRRISLEGYAYWPSLSPDGKKLYYRVLKGGTSPFLGASELWAADIESGRSEPLLPGIAVTGYEISKDGKLVIFSAVDRSHGPYRRSPPDPERRR